MKYIIVVSLIWTGCVPVEENTKHIRLIRSWNFLAWQEHCWIEFSDGTESFLPVLAPIRLFGVSFRSPWCKDATIRIKGFRVDYSLIEHWTVAMRLCPGLRCASPQVHSGILGSVFVAFDVINSLILAHSAPPIGNGSFVNVVLLSVRYQRQQACTWFQKLIHWQTWHPVFHVTLLMRGGKFASGSAFSGGRFFFFRGALFFRQGGTFLF